MDINRTIILANAIRSISSSRSASASASSSNTALTTSSAHGNGLSASTLISAGSTIISTYHPYHLILENSLLGTVCSWCLLPERKGNEVDSTTIRRCGRCQTPWYCSPTCQREHWKSAHKHECPVFSKLAQISLPGLLPTPVRALIEVLLIHDEGNSWQGLESHEEEFRKQRGLWDDVVLQARGAVMYSGLGESELGRAIGLLCRMKTNSFRFTSPTASGLLFEPNLAMANHSCNPNASLSCVGRTVYLTALRDIKESEQVFISYIDEDLPVWERNDMLRDRYFFDCACKRCVEEMKRDDGDPA